MQIVGLVIPLHTSSHAENVCSLLICIARSLHLIWKICELCFTFNTSNTSKSIWMKNVSMVKIHKKHLNAQTTSGIYFVSSLIFKSCFTMKHLCLSESWKLLWSLQILNNTFEKHLMHIYKQLEGYALAQNKWLFKGTVHSTNLVPHSDTEKLFKSSLVIKMLIF